MNQKISGERHATRFNPDNGAYRWVMLLCVCLAVSSASIEMTGPAPILTIIADDLNIKIGSATHLMMAYVFANAFCLTWGGVVCDKFGITAALVLGLSCTCIPAVLMPLDAANQFHAMFGLRLIQGAAPGFVFATVGHVLALWFPSKEQGIASGLMIGATPIGASIGVIASPFLLELTGSWQHTMAMLSIPGWSGIVLAALITSEVKTPELSGPLIKSNRPVLKEMTFVNALTLPYTWVGAGIMFCNAWCLFCLYNLLPSFLSTQAPVGAGLGSVMAGKLSLSLTLSGFFAMVAGGLFLDKIARGNYRTAITTGFFMTAITTYFILMPQVYHRTPLLIVCLLIAGWGIPFMNASISALIVNFYPANIIGRMMGLWFGVGTFGGAVGIYLGGLSIAKTESFYWAIIPISIAAVTGIVISKFLNYDKIPVGKLPLPG